MPAEAENVIRASRRKRDLQCREYKCDVKSKKRKMVRKCQKENILYSELVTSDEHEDDLCLKLESDYDDDEVVGLEENNNKSSILCSIHGEGLSNHHLLEKHISKRHRNVNLGSLRKIQTSRLKEPRNLNETNSEMLLSCIKCKESFNGSASFNDHNCSNEEGDFCLRLEQDDEGQQWKCHLYYEAVILEENGIRSSCMCSICLIRFATLDLLKKHIAISHGNINLGSLCNIQTSRLKELWDPKEIAAEVYLSCIKCKESFNGLASFNDHDCRDEESDFCLRLEQDGDGQPCKGHEEDILEENSIKSSFLCSNCLIRFATLDLLKKHFFESHRNVSIVHPCNIQSTILKEHRHLKETNSEMLLSCIKCKESFNSSATFSDHICSNEESDFCLRLEQDDNHYLEDQPHLQKVIWEENNIKSSFLCSICQIWFATLDLLKKHFSLSHRNVSIVHPCNIQTSQLKELRNLKETNSEMLLSCIKCKESLDSVTSFHSHKCCNEEVDFCLRLEQEQDDEMEPLYLEEDPFWMSLKSDDNNNLIKCEKCCQTFLNSASLMEHENDVHRGLQYECNVCLKRFHFHTSLNRHKHLYSHY